MKIAGHPIDLEPSFHPAALKSPKILINSFFLLITVSNLYEWIVAWQIVFINSPSNIDFMHF